MATALVTGAAGFAGRHLIAELERATDWDIIGFGRASATIGDHQTGTREKSLVDADRHAVTIASILVPQLQLV